jgi:hypothetical protein
VPGRRLAGRLILFVEDEPSMSETDGDLLCAVPDSASEGCDAEPDAL